MDEINQFKFPPEILEKLPADILEKLEERMSVLKANAAQQGPVSYSFNKKKHVFSVRLDFGLFRLLDLRGPLDRSSAKSFLTANGHHPEVN